MASLRSRRLEVAGERENGRARGRHACLLLARPFFLVPTTSKRLLRRLTFGRKIIPEDLGKKTFVMTILSDTEWETLKNEWIVAAIK